MTRDDLTRIESYCAAATPGPWIFSDQSDGLLIADVDGDVAPVFAGSGLLGNAEADENLRFASQARTDLPACVARIRELEAFIASKEFAAVTGVTSDDMVKFHGERMAEHRENAIAQRKRADAAEDRIKVLEEELASWKRDWPS